MRISLATVLARCFQFISATVGRMRWLQSSTFAARICGVAIVALPLSGCVSVPQYDATTDTNLSSLQSEIDAQLVKWISDVRSQSPADKVNATYAKNVDFYNKVDTDMLSLELRMEAVPDASTKNLPQYFSNLRQMVENLKATQQQDDAQNPVGYFNPGVLQQTRWQFAAQFAPLITYEQTLKGVSSAKGSSTSSTATKTSDAKASAPPH